MVKEKQTNFLPEIWKLVWDTLEEISDECGECELGEGYLLKYEGWSGICIDEIWEKVEVEHKKKGISIKRNEVQGAREEICYKFAEEQSYRIIDNEWIPELEERGYLFIDGGYDDGGLYGRTWALFKV